MDLVFLNFEWDLAFLMHTCTYSGFMVLCNLFSLFSVIIDWNGTILFWTVYKMFHQTIVFRNSRTGSFRAINNRFFFSLAFLSMPLLFYFLFFHIVSVLLKRDILVLLFNISNFHVFNPFFFFFFIHNQSKRNWKGKKNQCSEAVHVVTRSCHLKCTTYWLRVPSFCIA